jgi:hypothetical protein
VEENQIQPGDIIRVERIPHFAKTVRYQTPKKSLISNRLEEDGDTSFMKPDAQGNKLHAAQNESKPYRDDAPNPMDAPIIEPHQYGYDGSDTSPYLTPVPPPPKQEDRTELVPKKDLHDVPTDTIRPSKRQADLNDAPTDIIRPSKRQEDADKTTMLPKHRPNLKPNDEDKTTLIKKR